MEKIIDKNNSESIEDKLLKDNNEFKEKNVSDKFRYVFESFNFNNLNIKNHLFFKNLNDEMFYDKFGNPTNDFVKFYTRIANSDVGIIATGPIYLGGKGNNKFKNKPRLNSENKVINIYQKTISQVHSFGSKIFLNLKPIYGRGDDENKWLIFNQSVSVNVGISKSLPTKRISDGKCKNLIKEFASTAKVASRAKFDGVVVDGTLFDILGEFTLIELNRRTFGYYSGVEEFACAVVKEIVDTTPTINIIYSISLDSMIEFIYGKDYKNFNTLKPFKFKSTKKIVFNLLKGLVKAGVDGFYFEFGTFESEFFKNFNQYQKEGFFIEIVDEIKSYFRKINLKNKFNDNVLVVLNDNFNSLNNFDNLILNKKLDLIDITKFIYADLNYVKSSKNNKSVCQCIKCSHCNYSSDNLSKTECLLNPNLIDFESTKKPASSNLKVAVVGGGVSGIVCSLKLAERGYIVDIFEKNKLLNKTGRLNEIFGYDELFDKFNDFLEEKINAFSKEKKINLYLSKEADVNTLLKNEYYSVIVATGFKERFLKINGAVLKNVKTIYDVLESKDTLLNKDKFVIYARSELSLKFAIYLIKNHKKVSFLVDSVDFLLNLPNDKLLYYLYLFKQFKVDLFISFKINVIHEDFVELYVNNKIKGKDTMNFIMNNKGNLDKIKFEGKAKNIDLDLFVYEPEIYPNNKLYYDLVTERFRGEVYLIGNALQNTSLADDIKSGYFVGKNL